MSKSLWWLVLGFLCQPTIAFGVVSISEIAWMGDNVSANYEWIELYNNGAEVLVDDWTLTDSNNLEINLSGTIPANGYVVLERNRVDGQYHKQPPFLVYTGALVNSGATLMLKNSNDEIMDQVSGGADWENIGGDNTSKDTAQYTASGWHTGIPTPGRANSTTTTVPGGSNQNGNTSSSSSGVKGSSNTPSKSEPVKLVIPNVELTLTPKWQKVAYVHQPVDFTVEASGLGKTFLDSLVYAWNFGDLSTSTNKKVTHTYDAPGTYVVTVEAHFARHKQIGMGEITVLPVSVALARGLNGELLVHNNSPYDIDISGYSLLSERRLVFPPRSILATKATLSVPAYRLSDSVYRTVSLVDTNLAVVTVWSNNIAASITVQNNPTTVLSDTNLSILPSEIVESDVLPAVLMATNTAHMATSAMPAYVYNALSTTSMNFPTEDAPPGSNWAELGLLGLILGAIGTMLATGGKNSSNQEEI